MSAPAGTGPHPLRQGHTQADAAAIAESTLRRKPRRARKLARVRDLLHRLAARS